MPKRLSPAEAPPTGVGGGRQTGRAG